MTTPSRDRQQRAIDHEVLIGHALAVQAQIRAAREQRKGNKAALGEMLWLREQYFSILLAAGTEQEARDLGLTDEAIREVRLGSSVAEGWQRVHRLLSPPSRFRWSWDGA